MTDEVEEFQRLIAGTNYGPYDCGGSVAIGFSSYNPSGPFLNVLPDGSVTIHGSAPEGTNLIQGSGIPNNPSTSGEPLVTWYLDINSNTLWQLYRGGGPPNYSWSWLERVTIFV